MIIHKNTIHIIDDDYNFTIVKIDTEKYGLITREKNATQDITFDIVYESLLLEMFEDLHHEDLYKL